MPSTSKGFHYQPFRWIVPSRARRTLRTFLERRRTRKHYDRVYRRQPPAPRLRKIIREEYPF